MLFFRGYLNISQKFLTSIVFSKRCFEQKKQILRKRFIADSIKKAYLVVVKTEIYHSFLRITVT
jgi:hypothetical protein